MGNGSSNGYLTVGYRVSDATLLRARDYGGPGRGDDIARAMAVSPTQNRVFVTGNSPGRTSGGDYATIDYHG